MHCHNERFQNNMGSNIGKGTEKLYYEDAYMREFYGTVLSCGASGKLYDVVLDKTAFFPEEGGQSPDKGFFSLEDERHGIIKVRDVQIDEGVIHHFTDAPLEEGTCVHGILDWEHRFSNMQQHSAEHIYSGLVHKHFGYDNVGFHLSDNEVTMDYSGPLSRDEASKIELLVNEAIYKNIESIQSFPTPEELKDMDYRSKIEIDGQVRLITYPDYDICACCAPHVAHTGEIGIFKVTNVQNYKQGTRIHMLAGKRAFLFLANEHDILQETARSLTCGVPEFKGRVDSILADAMDFKRKLGEANAALLEDKIEALPKDEVNVCLFTEGLDSSNMRRAVNKMVETHKGACGIFDGNDKDGYKYVLGSSLDARPVNQMLMERFSARGGGNKMMTQGSIAATRADIEAFFNEFLEV